MLPQCCPLPSNLSPSARGVLRGTLSILRGQAAPRRGLPACGAACACRHPSQLRSSPGTAEEGNLGLVLQIWTSPGERSSAHMEALPKPSPPVTLAAFPWDADARSPQPAPKPGLPESCFPPALQWLAILCVLQGWVLARGLFSSCSSWWRISWGWGQVCCIPSVPAQPTHGSLPSSAPAPGGAGWACLGFVGFLASLSQPSWEKWKGCLLWHGLYSPISSSSSIPAGAGDTCLGSPRQARATPSENFGHTFGPGADSLLWVNSHCLAPSRARRFRAGSASGFQLLPFHCNLSGGAILQMLEETAAFFF